jgi:hypothetical protein
MLWPAESSCTDPLRISEYLGHTVLIAADPRPSCRTEPLTVNRRQSKLDVRQWLLRRLLLVRALVRGGGAYSCRPLSNFSLNLCNVGWIGQHSLHR